ncbi:MAG: metal ABC transporter permease [bacterium]|nr:metal ABC transporter permease [bacterium]
MWDAMQEGFLWRSLLGGLGVALAAGPLGCFIVWRGMAYFGAALSHAALLGVALGFFLQVNVTLGILVVCIVSAAGIALVQRQKRFSSDTLLGIMAHAALSLGLIAISFMERLRVDLLGYLFGDILAITLSDLYWIYGGCALAMAALAWLWRPLLAITVNADLASAEGISEGKVRMMFMLLIAVLIAIAMKVIGILLVHSLLIIPAAAARPLARTPEQMAALASLFGALAVLAGVFASFQWDVPSGPSVVVAATIIFLISLLADRLASGRSA